MIVKKKENCREGGQKSFFIATMDFASLQARLASIDTFLNECPDSTFDSPEGQAAKADPVLYNVYRDGSDTSDLHSMTGFGTFVGSTHMKGIKVHDDVDNKVHITLSEVLFLVSINFFEIIYNLCFNPLNISYRS